MVEALKYSLKQRKFLLIRYYQQSGHLMLLCEVEDHYHLNPGDFRLWGILKDWVFAYALWTLPAQRIHYSEVRHFR